MKKRILLLSLLAAFAVNTQAQTFTVLATDPATDATPVQGSPYLEGTELAYAYDDTKDEITFRVKVAAVLNQNYGINIMLDDENSTAKKSAWWGKQNSTFQYNVLFTAWIASSVSDPMSAFDIYDGDNNKLASATDMTITIDAANKAYLITIPRKKITSAAKLTAKVIAATGSNMGWADDLPNTGSGNLTADPNAGGGGGNGGVSVANMDITFSDFAVYPNPSSNGIITVEKTVSEAATISIYNVLGAKVYSTTTNDDKTIVDLSNQPAGNYFVKVGAGNKSATQTIILQ